MEKVLALYIPVFHEGYRLFLEKNKDASQLFLFDRNFLRHLANFDYLKKDIRALDVRLMKQVLEKLFPNLAITVIKKNQDWQKFQALMKEKKWQWVVSNDDFGRYLAKKYGKKQLFKFDSYFLRWDRTAVEQATHKQADKQIVGQTDKLTSKQIAKDCQPAKLISQSNFEKEVMAQAFEQANYSNDWWRQVGAVLIKDKQVLLATYNQHLPSRQEQYFNGDPRSIFSSGEVIELSSSIHAEALAIARAASQGIALAGTDLFVSTFPCPVCAKLVAATGIKRLYYCLGYALLDGWPVLVSAGVEIIKVEFSAAAKQALAKKQACASNLKKPYS